MLSAVVSLQPHCKISLAINVEKNQSEYTIIFFFFKQRMSSSRYLCSVGTADKLVESALWCICWCYQLSYLSMSYLTLRKEEATRQAFLR